MANKPRAKMPVSERAKQFSPFAALRGLDAAMERKRRELGLEKGSERSEYREDALDRAYARLSPGQQLTVVFYQNGVLATACGTLRPTDPCLRILRVGETTIPMDAVSEIILNETADVPFPGGKESENYEHKA